MVQTTKGSGRKEPSGLWSKKGRARLESLPLAPWISRRRQELLELLGLLDRLNPMIDKLSKAIEQEAARRPEVQLLMTHPGVGPIAVLASVLIIGTSERFHCGRQIASYLGFRRSVRNDVARRFSSLAIDFA